MVQAFDVRSAVKEQIESLGARFLELDMGLEDAEAAGGYARELTDEEQQRQRELLAEEIGKVDAVISTAAVPGRRAPLLVTEQAVKNMAPGSVIVDLAAETGGNCELTEPGQTVVKEGVTIFGKTGLPSTMPAHASQLYAKNIQSLLELMAGEEGALELDFEDEIIAGACITRDGEIVHEGAKQAAGAAGVMDVLTELTILVLAAFVGFEVISKVPNTLHTPLMSATNAIHGIVLLGGLLLIGEATGFLNELILVIAIAFGTINVVGGFLVTDRMLEMFRKRPGAEEGRRSRPNDRPRLLPPGPGLHPGLLHRRLQPLHLRHAPAQPPEHGAPGQHGGRGGHGDRGGRHAADRGGRRLRADRARDRDRHGGRDPRGAQREDDRDAADGGAVQRRRRRGGGADRLGGVPRGGR